MWFHIKLLVWSVGEEPGNRKSEHRGFSFGSVICWLWRECEVDNKQALSGPVRCGTLTFNTHPVSTEGLVLNRFTWRKYLLLVSEAEHG